MEQDNGGVKKLPAISIAFDPDAQIVHLQFDPNEFKTWDYILSLLNMARQKAEENQAIGRMLNAKAMMEQAAQQQSLIRRLRG